MSGFSNSQSSNAGAIPIRSAAGLGAMALVPAGTTNGAPLGVMPAGAMGARLYLNTGDSVTFTIAGSQPASAPSVTFTASAATTGGNWDEQLTSGQMIYVTALTGTPSFRWY